MLMKDDDSLSSILENLESFEHQILNYERALGRSTHEGESHDAVHALFRHAHNLKGSLSANAQPEAASLLHAIESTLDLMRSGKLNPSREFNQQCLHGLDLIRALITDTDSDEPNTERHSAMKELTDTFLSYKKDINTGKKKLNFTLTDEELRVSRAQYSKKLSFYLLEKLVSRNMSSEDIHELPVLDDIKAIGQIVATRIKEPEAVLDSDEPSVLKIVFASDVSPDDISLHIFDPLKILDVSDVVGEAREVKQVPGTSGRRKGKTFLKILIVDDEYVSLRIMQHMLTSIGLCDFAMNSAEAFQKVQLAYSGAPYDLIFMDIVLPDGNGQDVLAKIRNYEEDHAIQSSNRAKIIMTSALADRETVSKAFREQCDAYLVKPIQIDKITELLSKWNMHFFRPMPISLSRRKA